MPEYPVHTSAPYDKLFPLVKAVVHHSGIGTTAQCLKAGIPFLVCPVLHPMRVPMKINIGFIGVGAMGGPMVRNLLKSGNIVRAYDRDAARLSAITAAGAETATDEMDAIQEMEVIGLSLPSSNACVTVAGTFLISHLQTGQVVIDFGTTIPRETRQIAMAVREHMRVLDRCSGQ